MFLYVQYTDVCVHSAAKQSNPCKWKSLKAEPTQFVLDTQFRPSSEDTFIFDGEIHLKLKDIFNLDYSFMPNSKVHLYWDEKENFSGNELSYGSNIVLENKPLSLKSLKLGEPNLLQTLTNNISVNTLIIQTDIFLPITIPENIIVTELVDITATLHPARNSLTIKSEGIAVNDILIKSTAPLSISFYESFLDIFFESSYEHKVKVVATSSSVLIDSSFINHETDIPNIVNNIYAINPENFNTILSISKFQPFCLIPSENYTFENEDQCPEFCIKSWNKTISKAALEPILYVRGNFSEFVKIENQISLNPDKLNFTSTTHLKIDMNNTGWESKAGFFTQISPSQLELKNVQELTTIMTTATFLQSLNNTGSLLDVSFLIDRELDLTNHLPLHSTELIQLYLYTDIENPNITVGPSTVSINGTTVTFPSNLRMKVTVFSLKSPEIELTYIEPFTFNFLISINVPNSHLTVTPPKDCTNFILTLKGATLHTVTLEVSSRSLSRNYDWFKVERGDLILFAKVLPPVEPTSVFHPGLLDKPYRLLFWPLLF